MEVEFALRNQPARGHHQHRRSFCDHETLSSDATKTVKDRQNLNPKCIAPRTLQIKEEGLSGHNRFLLQQNKKIFNTS